MAGSKASTAEARTTVPAPKRSYETSWWFRISPFCILIPTAVSVAVGVLHLGGYRNSGILFYWSVSRRSFLQVVIHILSSLLSFLWAFPICRMISYYTRYRFANRSIKISTLRLWSAISRTAMDWKLPWSAAFLAFGFFTLAYLPATLWAGALTPTAASKLVHGISFPAFGRGPRGNNSILFPPAPEGVPLVDCWIIQQVNGTFSNCPMIYNTGSLLLTVASASSPDMTPRNHSKWDHTKYQYIGRSFGVGAASGLSDQSITALPDVQTYSYTEIGLAAETTCIYNQSAAYELQIKTTPTDSNYPNTYFALAALPNCWEEIRERNPNNATWKGWDHYAQFGFAEQRAVVSTFHRSLITSENDSYYFGMLAMDQYRQLDKMQCQITFEPASFRVDVSVANATIRATRDGKAAAEVEDIDPGRRLRKRAVANLSLSWVISSLYGSTVGDAFMQNVRNLQIRQGFAPDANASDSTVLAAVEDSVTGMVDDALVAFASASLTQVDSTQLIDAVVTIAAVQIGSAPFILAAVVVNLVGFTVVVALKVVIWRADVPLFDYNDLGCMAVGVVRGGADEDRVAREKVVGRLEKWNGDPKSEEVGCLEAKLEVADSSGQPTIILI